MSGGAVADLDAMISRLRGMRDVTTAIASEAAPRVAGVVQRTAAAGTDVDGRPWPVKRDGSRALPNAASAVRAKAVGETIVVSLDGPYVYHNAADGPDRRRILPETGTGVPDAIAAAIVEAGDVVWRKRAGAR